MREGETITMHKLGCAALTNGVCICGGHRVTILRPLHDGPRPSGDAATARGGAGEGEEHV